jgi:WD40 repeat protein
MAVVAGVALLGFWLRSPLPPPRIVGSKQITNDGLPKSSLLTDGNRIYFTENTPSGFSISQVSSTGGDVALVDVPLANLVRRHLGGTIRTVGYQAAQFDAPLWSMPVPAGSPRRLGDIVGHDAVWSPTGKLVFGKGNDLYIAEHNGTDSRKFATAPDYPSTISFSPDGNRIRFTVANLVNNSSAIWEAGADGSNMHALFPAGTFTAVLRKVDSRWEVLCFSKLPRGRQQYLDRPRPL